MTDLSLEFIGTGNAFVPEGMCWNGFVANDRTLFEAPPSALMALRKLERDPDAIETVFISHHHGDHFLGLPMLLLHWKYFGRRTPVTVAGPAGTFEAAKAITDVVYPGVFDGDSPVEWATIKAGDRFRAPGLEVEIYPMTHDERLECLGFRARIGRGKLGYTGDTALCDPVLDLARDTDVLVAECTSVDRVSDIHMNLKDDIARLRSRVPGSTEILLTHLTANIPDTGLGGVRVAEDFATYRY